MFVYFLSTAGSGVGASASLAGDVNNGGSFGVGQADAYAGGVRKEVIKTVSTTNVIANGEPTVVGTTVDVASVSAIPTQSHQLVSEVDETETQSIIPTSTPGHHYIPPKKIEQSDQSSDSDQLEPVRKIEGTDQSSDSDQLEPVKKIEQSDQSSDSDQLEPSNQSDQSSDSDQLEPVKKVEGTDQSSDSDQLEPENPEKSQPTTKSQIQSTTTMAPTTTVNSPSMV